MMTTQHFFAYDFDLGRATDAQYVTVTENAKMNLMRVQIINDHDQTKVLKFRFSPRSEILPLKPNRLKFKVKSKFNNPLKIF